MHLLEQTGDQAWTRTSEQIMIGLATALFSPIVHHHHPDFLPLLTFHHHFPSMFPLGLYLQGAPDMRRAPTAINIPTRGHDQLTLIS